jgi:hypothetical protein
MSSLYPYSPSTAFVNGRAEVLYENTDRSVEAILISVTFQQASFSSVPTTGNLSFKLSFVAFDGKCIERCTCVTPTQATQSYNGKIIQNCNIIYVKCTSDVSTDAGIPVTITLGSLAEGSTKRRKLHKSDLSKLRNCRSIKPCSSIVLPCPTVTTVVPNETLLDTVNFTISGTNLAVLIRTCCCQCSLLPTIKTIGTLTQGSVTKQVQIVPASTRVATVTVQASNDEFSAGTAYLNITPVKSTCETIVLSITLIAPIFKSLTWTATTSSTTSSSSSLLLLPSSSSSSSLSSILVK